MGHKYKATKQLKAMIDSGAVPHDINIREVIDGYYKYLKVKKPRRAYTWKDKPRFYDRALAMNYRARKAGDDSKITADELEEVWAAYGGICTKCGADKHICFDHIVSYYRGGKNKKENLQLLCRLCNMEKGVH